MDAGSQNVRAVEVVRGRDHKLYPAHQLTREQRNQARWLVHALVCRDRNSVRAAQKIMSESYAVRRSLGALNRDLRLFECPDCADD